MANYIVTTSTDENDAGASVGIPGGTGLSLREAIELANSNAGADTITFDSSIFTGGANSFIRLTEGELVISEALTIDGSGATDLVITGDADNNDTLVAGTFITDVGATDGANLGDNSRVMNASADLTLNDLTITGGHAAAGGGGIRGGSNVTIDTVTIRGNSTTGESAHGGGFHASSDVSVTNSTISENSTAGTGSSGGGFYSGNEATVTSSTISGNSTASNNAHGGGFFAYGAEISNSTISDNSTAGANALGGGFYSYATNITNSTVSGNSTVGDDARAGGFYAYSATIANATVSGNSTAGDAATGGGFYAYRATITNSTISGNSVTGTNASGGGFYGYEATLTNSIVLGNENVQGGYDELYTSDSLSFQGANIVGADTAAFDAGTDDNVDNADPATVFANTVANGSATAGVLADNGGSVLTIALLADAANPALDVGTAPEGVTTDASGNSRDVDIAGVDNGGTVDAGAMEFQGEAQSLVVTTAADMVDSFDGETSLREAINFANNNAGSDTITFDSSIFTGGANSLIRLTEGELVISEMLTVDGSGATDLVITGDADNNDTLVAGTFITDVDATDDANFADNSRVIDASSDFQLNDLTITGGRAAASGGGLRSSEGILLETVTVSGNSTVGEGASGGGLHAYGAVLRNATISGNSTVGEGAIGGGFYAYIAVIDNSTISDNSTAGDEANGGGFYAYGAYITNSTISGNSVTGTNASGGGLYGYGATLTNSIVLGNDNVQGGHDELYTSGFLSFEGTNIVGADTAAFDASTDDNVDNADPATVFANTVANGSATAGVLADNGGSVLTIALLADAANPALDVGTALEDVTIDAAGNSRDIDIAGVDNGGTVDAGAVELQEIPAPDPTPDPTPVPTPDPVVDNSDSGGSSGSDAPDTPTVTQGSSNADVLNAGDDGENINAGSGDDSVSGGAGDDSIVGGNGDDEILAGDDDQGDDLLQGNRGADILGGGFGNDLIVGGDASDDLDTNNLIFAGDDTLFGGEGDDLIVGGSYDTKTKTAYETGSGDNLIWAGTGNDSVIGDANADIIGGGEGNDSISAGGGNDIIYGGKGDPDQNNDTLAGGAGGDQVFASVGEDDVAGGDGEDTLFGGAGDDTVDGGSGADQIWGGPGDDALTGGDGNDTFSFISGFGTDIISDFGNSDGNDDILDLSGIDDLTLADLQNTATFEGGDAHLNIGEHGTIVLTGIDATELQGLFDDGQILVA